MDGVNTTRAWRLMWPERIHHRDGSQLLFRVRVIQTPWAGIYVHHLTSPDTGDLHDHPWNFLSIVVRGGYDEILDPAPADRSVMASWRTWGRWSVHRMRTTSAHRIESVQPGTWTIVVTGRRARRWGFWHACRWTDWADYIGAK